MRLAGKSFLISRHFPNLNLSVFKFPVYVVNNLVSNMNVCLLPVGRLEKTLFLLEVKFVGK